MHARNGREGEGEGGEKASNAAKEVIILEMMLVCSELSRYFAFSFFSHNLFIVFYLALVPPASVN